MSERSPKREQIYQIGTKLVDAGEEAIFEAILAKNELWLSVIQNLQNGKINIKEARLLKREVQDMIDVIEVAQNIQRVRGEDIDSEIKKAKIRSAFGRFEK